MFVGRGRSRTDRGRPRAATRLVAVSAVAYYIPPRVDPPARGAVGTERVRPCCCAKVFASTQPAATQVKRLAVCAGRHR